MDKKIGRKPYSPEFRERAVRLFAEHRPEYRSEVAALRGKLLTGHRHRDRTGIEPLFPLAHEPGYTTFALDRLSGEACAESADLRAQVTDSGSRRGSTAVQRFPGPDPVPEGRPRRQLRAFAKVTLDPGARTIATLRTDRRSFRRRDPSSPGWQPVPGRRTAEAGFPASDIRARTGLGVAGWPCPAAAARPGYEGQRWLPRCRPVERIWHLSPA